MLTQIINVVNLAAVVLSEVMYQYGISGSGTYAPYFTAASFVIIITMLVLVGYAEPNTGHFSTGTAQTETEISGISGSAATWASLPSDASRSACRYFDIWACAALQLHVFQPARRRAVVAATAIFGKRLDRVAPLPKGLDPEDEGAGRFQFQCTQSRRRPGHP